MKRLVLIAVVLAMSGCASQNVWVKPGSNQAQFDQAKAECQMHGQQAEASTIGYNGFLAGYENAETYNACMRGKGFSLMDKSAASAAVRSQIVWVKELNYSNAARDKDLSDCKRLNLNADGVPPCMRARGYVAVTAGQLFDASKKAVSEGLVPSSVSNEQEDQDRKQKIIHMVLASH